ncbi:MULTISPECIES: sensor histidine kinase [Streptomyces]|uniref:sensor histidine kinase n=1 Tax=Streptomyces TaxID=1883 RepID=UPI000A3E18A6|nr:MULTISPECIES: histidine kinase [Streptomyces]
MVGRIRAWQHGWHAWSKIQKVEWQSLVVWHAMPWVFFLSWGSLPIALSLHRGFASQFLGWAVIAAAALQGVHVNRTLRRSLDHYLKRGPVPRRDLAVSTLLMAVTLGFAVALQTAGGVDMGMINFIALYLTVPFGQSLAFSVSLPGFALRFLLLDAVVVGSFAAAGVRGRHLVAIGVLIVFGAIITLLSSRCGAWTLSAMWEADRAREVEARLAVAEERLRFGRDLHDVMGRNLAVIALKSELAVQLARRGRPEAVDQMVEVQRIAQESQREVREVVRGYREVDLGVELAGAQGVLEAAGIDCRLTGSAAGLAAPVQSALGWAVREAATNVLRHGDARRCEITLTVDEERTTLVVENDGVPETAPAGRGSGLAGLRERLAAVDGTLDFGTADGVFRLTVRVPGVPAHDGRSRRGRDEARDDERDEEVAA